MRSWAYNDFGVLMGTSWRASCLRWPSWMGDSWPMRTLFLSQGDFCATAIDLVFHTQVCKLKRDMTHNNAVSASSIAFMHNEGMEVIDETPVHSPATACSRPASVGA